MLERLDLALGEQRAERERHVGGGAHLVQAGEQRHRQAHAAVLRRRGEADPAALGERAVGLGEAGRVRTTPFSSRARSRSPARRSGASTSSASFAASPRIASTVSGVASAKRRSPPAGQRRAPGRAGSASRRRGRDRSRGWAPRGGRAWWAAMGRGRRIRPARPHAKPARGPAPTPTTPTSTTIPSSSRQAARPRARPAGLLRAGELVALPDRDGLRARGRRADERRWPASSPPRAGRLQPADRARRRPADGRGAGGAAAEAARAGGALLARPADPGAAAPGQERARRAGDRGARHRRGAGAGASGGARPAQGFRRAAGGAVGEPVRSGQRRPRRRM